MKLTKRAIISGGVQGVWYRDWTVQTATELGLKGWVKNCDDGTVEAVFCGEEEKIAAMVKACYEGPPAARVEQIELKDSEMFDGNDFSRR